MFLYCFFVFSGRIFCYFLLNDQTHLGENALFSTCSSLSVCLFVCFFGGICFVLFSSFSFFLVVWLTYFIELLSADAPLRGLGCTNYTLSFTLFPI